MAGSLITFAQLQVRPGFDNVNQDTAEALIDDVSALVKDIADPIELDAATLPESLVPVLTSMVRRGLDNPRGLSSEQVGDVQWQGSGTIYATRREDRLIRRAVGKPGVGAITLQTDLPLPPGTYRGALDGSPTGM